MKNIPYEENEYSAARPSIRICKAGCLHYY